VYEGVPCCGIIHVATQSGLFAIGAVLYIYIYTQCCGHVIRSAWGMLLFCWWWGYIFRCVGMCGYVHIERSNMGLCDSVYVSFICNVSLLSL
jgi:hypothetical protein